MTNRNCCSEKGITDTNRHLIFNILCWGSFAFSSIFALFSISGIFFSGWYANTITMIVPALSGAGIAILLSVFILLLILAVLSFSGTLLMFRNQKKGFILYIVPNGLMLVFQIILFFEIYSIIWLIIALINIVIIILFSMFADKMK